MSRLLPIDGSGAEGGGQIVRTALTLSAVTGQAFEIKQIRARRSRSGLLPEHVAAVRAVAMCCGARVGGVFEGSPDLRFEPGALSAGQYRFEIGTAGSATLLLQTVLPVLGKAVAKSDLVVCGGTHVPRSPCFEYLDRHWSPAVSRFGLQTGFHLAHAGFNPRGGGEVRASVAPWANVASAVSIAARGKLVGVKGVSGAGRVKGEVARRQRDAAQGALWENRRIEAEWELVEVPSAGPGSFVLLQAVYETGAGAFGVLGERGISAERIGARVARRLLHFMGQEEGAVDGHLADQLVAPLALSGHGGTVSTSEVTSHLETVVKIASQFGVRVRLDGRRGGPGMVEVAR